MLALTLGRLTISLVPRWTWGRWREAGLVTVDLGCLCLEWLY